MRDDRYEEYDNGYAAPYQEQRYDDGNGYDPGMQEREAAPQREPREPRVRGERPVRESTGRRPARDGVDAGQRPAPARRQEQAPVAGAGNPVLNGLKAAGGAVAGAFSGVAGAVSSRVAQSRAVEYEDGDYVGTGAPCRMCGHPVDHLQSRCPHCGTLVRPVTQRTSFWVAVIVLVALVVVLTLAIGSCKANQAGDPGTPAVSSDVTQLQTLVDDSNAALDEQRETHPYTRYTAYNLRQAVTAAETVLDDTSATSSQRSEAYSNLNNAKGALLTLATTYEWPVFGENLLTEPVKWSTKQVGLNCTVASINMADDGGLSSMVVSDPNNAANQLTVYFYPVDIKSSYDVGSNINVYGEFVYDGTNMALWADKIEAL